MLSFGRLRESIFISRVLAASKVGNNEVIEPTSKENHEENARCISRSSVFEQAYGLSSAVHKSTTDAFDGFG